MNNKQLAEMIKKLRKEKQEELTDINTTSSMKGVTHDVAEDNLNEFQARAGRTHSYVGSKAPNDRMAHRDAVSIPKSGASMKNRYTLHKLAEKKETSNTKTNIINTTPEQDSAMIGTQ